MPNVLVACCGTQLPVEEASIGVVETLLSETLVRHAEDAGARERGKPPLSQHGPVKRNLDLLLKLQAYVATPGSRDALQS